jgi:polyribonucleotide nucleotidyltransferase
LPFLALRRAGRDLLVSHDGAVRWYRDHGAARLLTAAKTGEVLVGNVSDITDEGVVLELAPYTVGLVPRSKLPERWLENYARSRRFGQRVRVTVTTVNTSGRARLALHHG